MEKDKKYLNNLRHSTAHLLAAAVLEIWPKAKLAIGPSIEDGFYYDIDFGKEKASEEDFPKIEKEMTKLIKEWEKMEQINESISQIKKRFKGNSFKTELIKGFEKEGKKISLYKSGNFVDLCKGGHVKKPNQEIKHFKLLSMAGAYWKGDEKKPMLTRIYGTVFPTKAELESHLTMLKEAKKRDHKKLGKEMDLFTFSDLIGKGLPLWTPKGALIRNILDDYVWQLRKKRGYKKVEIPHITKKILYETSGHWEKFENELFKIETREGHIFVMKPMNCPHHTQIFDRRPHSYKEMPQQYSNTTMVYRDEQSGELSGLSRVRSITQDDAHVFCRENQVEEEMNKIWDIIDEFYSAVGFKLEVRLSLSDPEHPEDYLGGKEKWKKAESIIRRLAKKRGVEFIEQKGEAAFYGPKIDFMAKDSLGREWQVATNQLDMNMPERFKLTCINEKGKKERIVMLHAAIMGSIERYLSILIEHFAGAFPVWLSPVQVKVLPITDKQLNYAENVAKELEETEIRVELNDRNETLGAKIRGAQKEKVPYMVILGDKEKTSKRVSVRLRDGEDLGQMSLEEFKKRVLKKNKTKSLEL